MVRILLVEDNVNMAYGLRNNLEIEGYEVLWCANGLEVMACLQENRVDLIILDLMLPGLDGFQVLQRLRDAHFGQPVLILSAKNEELDKVRGFRFGADQYLTKPFSVLELLARVSALLQRFPANVGEREAQPGEFHFGDVRVNTKTREVMKMGAAVALAPKEFDLLVALLARKGAVATREALIREVWGYPETVHTRTVDTHMGELRRKLEDHPSHPKYLLTVRKAGYRLTWCTGS